MLFCPIVQYPSQQFYIHGYLPVATVSHSNQRSLVLLPPGFSHIIFICLSCRFWVWYLSYIFASDPSCLLWILDLACKPASEICGWAVSALFCHSMNLSFYFSNSYQGGLELGRPIFSRLRSWVHKTAPGSAGNRRLSVLMIFCFWVDFIALDFLNLRSLFRLCSALFLQNSYCSSYFRFNYYNLISASP